MCESIKFGINSAANYTINSANKAKYRFGGKFSASSFIFYPIISSTTVISPNLGLLYEHTEQSKLGSDKIDLTGGSILHGSVGAQISFNKISIGLNTQLPLAQNFAEDQTKAKIKGMAQVSFAF